MEKGLRVMVAFCTNFAAMQLKFFLMDQNDRKCIKKLDRDFHKFLALLGLTTQHYGHRHRSKLSTRALPRVSRARGDGGRPDQMGAAREKSQRDRPFAR